MVAAPLALAAVEGGAVADRDEGILEAQPALVVGVDVAGGDGRHAERGGELLEGGVPAGVAALVGALQLDVERTREDAGESCGGVRVAHGEPVAGAAGEADEPLGMLGDERGGGRGGEQLALASLDAGAGVGVGEDPAEVLVAASRLAEERDVRIAFERDLGAGDRAEPEVLGGVGELERAVDAVVVGQRERVVAELGGSCRELLRQRRPVEKGIRRVRVQLDVAHRRPASQIDRQIDLATHAA